MQRRTLMIVGAALTSVVFMPAALAADGLPYDAKGDPLPLWSICPMLCLTVSVRARH